MQLLRPATHFGSLLRLPGGLQMAGGLEQVMHLGDLRIRSRRDRRDEHLLARQLNDMVGRFKIEA